MPKIIDEIGNMEADDELDAALPGLEAEPGSAERSNRLRQAVKSAGGGTVIARKVGMPLGTLSRYQRGREMKAGAMIALAEATGVRLEWLATGAGPMRPGEPPPAPAATPPSPAAEPCKLFGKVKIDRLERAWDAAVTGAQGDKRLTLHLMLVLYDELSAEAEKTNRTLKP